MKGLHMVVGFGFVSFLRSVNAFHVPISPIKNRVNRGNVITRNIRMAAGGDGEEAEVKPRTKIVVTGVGAVSPLGWGDDFWNGLIEGKSGITKLPEWASEYPASIAGQVPDNFNPSDFMDAKEVKRQARFTHLAMAASKLAIEDSKLDISGETTDMKRVGCLLGSGIGGVEVFENNCKNFEEAGAGKKGLRRVSPFLIPSLIPNAAAGTVAIELGLKGPNYCSVSACASGTHTIGDAFYFLENGHADVILAGGSEAAITPLCYAGFNNIKAVTTAYNDNPTVASRPFDKNRSGFVMAEGAGMLVLETEEHALKRGATIYCELSGYGATCDAHHITAPHPEGEGLAGCIEMALKHGGIKPEEVDYINAHGTSTPYNDKFETLAIKRVFGDHASKLKISSIKSMIGHSLGAAGALEAIACAKTIKEGIIAPTINYETPDEDCDLDYVPNKAEKVDVNVAISDNLGFGGHNAALVFKKYTSSA